MKQFIITVLMAIGFALGMTAQEISLTPVQTFPSSITYYALDKDGNLHLAAYTKNSDKTVTFYIYNKDLSIAHTVTSKQTFQFDIYEASWGTMYDNVLKLYDGLTNVEGEVILSQTLFNDDEEWEFGIRRYTYDNSTYITTNEYTIYNESGEKYNFPKLECYPEKYIANGSTQYIGFASESYSDDEDYMVYYSAQGTNSARAPELNENKINVAPNPVRAGQAFTVSFTNAMTETCIFSVLDLNGVSIYSSDIQAGETAKTVPGNTLSPGMYLYTVSSADGLVQSGKIIVQ